MDLSPPVKFANKQRIKTSPRLKYLPQIHVVLIYPASYVAVLSCRREVRHPSHQGGYGSIVIRQATIPSLESCCIHFFGCDKWWREHAMLADAHLVRSSVRPVQAGRYHLTPPRATRLLPCSRVVDSGVWNSQCRAQYHHGRCEESVV